MCKEIKRVNENHQKPGEEERKSYQIWWARKMQIAKW